MTNAEFDALVAQLEERSRRDPSGYRLRVVLLALAGYGYLALMLAILIPLFVGALAAIVVLKFVALKIAIPIGIFVWLVLKALWVRIPPPEGRALQREEAPALFALVDELRRKLRAPHFHRILITGDFNAAIVQVPRLGMLGWYQNHLLIGLPLMKSLTAAQFEAVLAHEFGHLAGGHGRLSNWIYRLRMSWTRLLGVLHQQKSWGTFMFRPFFNWYAPYFNAYSFPLARANEYEADDDAARLTSAPALAQALTAVHVVGSYLEERYWPQVHKQADELPQPAFAPFSGMGGRFESELEETDVRRWLEQAMARKTTADNTHPSLADRLKALSEAPRLAPPAVGNAADVLLGATLPVVTAEFDRRWHETILPAWQQRHREVQEGRKRLAELDTLAGSQGELPLRDAYERARLTDAFGAGADAALEQFRRLHERTPDDAVVCLALGQRLLARDEENGYELVERAIRLDENAIVAGCELLRDFCWRKGREQQAREWHQRLIDRAQLQELAREEREGLHVRDKLDTHGVPDAVIAELRSQLQAVPGLRKAYFVRKRVKHLPHRPCYVLGHVVTPRFRFHRKRRAAEAQERIVSTVNFPGETLVINVEGDNYAFGRKLRFMKGSRIL